MRARLSTPEELVGVVIEGKYRVCEVIGQGGMGTVYEAEVLASRHRVAVKVLKADQLQKKESVSRFEHEGRVVAAIRHPNICQVFDVGRLSDGSPYMVMERLRGQTLADRLEQAGKVAPGELCEIMVEALSALEAAHRQGVVHRDLKPDNIFIGDQAGRRSVKVLDFGIAKATGLQDAAGSLTRTGMVMGTPYYMAPEQAMGERNLDRRVDVWGAGVVLYEALTGVRPFVAKNYNALLVQILTAAPKRVDELMPGLPSGLAAVVHQALEKKREGRFQSAGELRQALMDVEWADVRRPVPPASAANSSPNRAPMPTPAMAPRPVTPIHVARPVAQGLTARPAGAGFAHRSTAAEPVMRVAAGEPPVGPGALTGRAGTASRNAISRGTMIGAGVAIGGGSRGQKHSFSELETEETRQGNRADEGDEELTIVLLRDAEDEATTIEDSDRTEVDPPSFLEEASETPGSTTERRRRQ